MPMAARWPVTYDEMVVNNEPGLAQRGNLGWRNPRLVARGVLQVYCCFWRNHQAADAAHQCEQMSFEC